MSSAMDSLRDLINKKPVEGGFNSPLREFKGKLLSWEPNEDKKFNRTRVQLDFVELEVIESTEPYTLPTTQILIPHSERNKSKWGYFYNSLLEAMGEGSNLDMAVGMRLHVKVTGGHKIWDKDTNGEKEHELFTVVGIEGMTPAAGVAQKSASIIAIELLDGKTEQEFNQAALRDNAIKSDPALIAQIVGRQFVQAMVTAGAFTKDADGRFHRVQVGN
jgi:hypothetical protein